MEGNAGDRIIVESERCRIFARHVKLRAFQKRAIGEPFHREIALPDLANEVEIPVNAELSAEQFQIRIENLFGKSRRKGIHAWVYQSFGTISMFAFRHSSRTA